MRMTLNAGGSIDSVKDSVVAQAGHFKQENPTLAGATDAVVSHALNTLGAVRRPGDAAARVSIDVEILVDVSGALSPSEIVAFEQAKAERRAKADAAAEAAQVGAIPAQPKPE